MKGESEPLRKMQAKGYKGQFPVERGKKGEVHIVGEYSLLKHKFYFCKKYANWWCEAQKGK